MKRYKHNLGHTHLITQNMGGLYPIANFEALPGDTIQHHTNVLTRVSPLVAPVFHPVTVRIHHFFVPMRLVWNTELGDPGSWEDFITGGNSGADTQTVPLQNTGNVAKTLYDYMGIDPTADIQVNATLVRAFNLVFNEFYRDQDLVPERSLNDTSVPNIAWEKDYFTASRPWSQRGPDVTIPVRSVTTEAYETDGTTKIGDLFFKGSGDGSIYAPAGGADRPTQLQGMDALARVNDFRRAFAYQRYQENRARFGARYTEYLRYQGVIPRDSRLQRPELLGGGRAQIQFSEVLQTTPEPQGQEGFGVGDLYGHGISAIRSNRYRRYMEEHGWILTLMSTRPKAMYPQSAHKMWFRQDKEDFYQRELEHIGQQEIQNREIYSKSASPKETFGYQDRYDEYRTIPSRVSGEFRDVLNYWHLGREFSAQPVLNKSFIDCVPSKRIHNEQTKDALWVMCQHKIMARRNVGRSAAPRIF